MTYGSCEVLWLILLQELGFKKSGPTFSYCESTSTLHIINNSVYHGITKYIEVDWNSSESIVKKEIQLDYTNTEDQIANFLIEAVTKEQLCDVLSPSFGVAERRGLISN
eukprot:TRINITY_DN10649_c1_g1_i2.p1 TRINITY_DN10649_c1_g1~~TRINITY_DN10649_c1_g1_i2.p1  ORF type:complete len:109 (-),score=11.95 TRINITY_DN10649_c1_g1_i2:307-633(-)